jgi:hypothetical protein
MSCVDDKEDKLCGNDETKCNESSPANQLSDERGISTTANSERRGYFSHVNSAASSIWSYVSPQSRRGNSFFVPLRLLWRYDEREGKKSNAFTLRLSGFALNVPAAIAPKRSGTLVKHSSQLQ